MIRLIATVALVCWASFARAEGAFVGCGLGALLGAAIVETEPLITVQAFTEKAAAALNERLPAAESRVLGELTISIKDEEGAEAAVSIGNFYYDHACNERKRAGAIDGLVAAVLQHRSAHAETARDYSRIVPIIRDRRWLTETENRLKTPAPGQALLFEPLTGGLVILYAEDRAEASRFLRAHENIGLKRAALRKIAIRNLRRIFSRVQARIHDNLFLVLTGGDYATSMVLLNFASYQQQSGSPPLVAAPTANVLLMGTTDRETLSAMRKYMVELGGPDRAPPEATLFVYRKGQFVKFDGR